jgi:hypothetical protein
MPTSHGRLLLLLLPFLDEITDDSHCTFNNALKRDDNRQHLQSLQRVCSSVASALSPLKVHYVEYRHSILYNVRLVGYYVLTKYHIHSSSLL